MFPVSRQPWSKARDRAQHQTRPQDRFRVRRHHARILFRSFYSLINTAFSLSNIHGENPGPEAVYIGRDSVPRLSV